MARGLLSSRSSPNWPRRQRITSPSLLSGIKPGQRRRVMHKRSVTQRNEDVNVR